MQRKILELGTIVTDTVTGMKGMLLICEIDMANNEQYIFQPKGLNQSTNEPLELMFINKARVKDGKEVSVDLPIEILGTEVEDLATGFKGTVIEIDYHLNGCIHCNIKPKGSSSTGDSIKPINVDIRRLKGKAIKKLSQTELAESKKKTPSPEGKPFRVNK